MEDECSNLSWEFCYQEEGSEDLRHSLLYTTLELEATIATAKEEIARRECELIHLNDLLNGVIKERDEAQAKCEKLMLEKLELQQQFLQQKQQQVLQNNQQHQGYIITQNYEEELQGGISEKHSVSAASSDCEENSMPSHGENSTPNLPQSLQFTLELAEKKPLPEKGKLLKAVVEAGPLLQTLLLAGPLPQWEHPPPQLNSIEIPPLLATIPSSNPSILPQETNKSFNFSNKRERDPVHCGAGAELCHVSKCIRVIQQLPTTTPTTASSLHSLPHPSFS